MRLLDKIREYNKRRQYQRESDAASRQMRQQAMKSTDARLRELEIRVKNELRQR